MTTGRPARTAIAQALTLIVLAAITPSVVLADFQEPQAVQLPLANPAPLETQAPAPQQGIAGAQPSAPTREVAAAVAATHPEDAAVRIPLDAYLRGHETGDAASFHRAFWKEARLWWVREGQVATRTAEEYIVAVSGRRPADREHRRRLVSVEFVGETAVAIIEIDYPGVRLTDQLTLQRIGEEWRIVTKSFYSEPRTAA